jgi:hypothetical protein
MLNDKFLYGIVATVAAITLNWYVTRKLDEMFPAKVKAVQ